MDKNTFLALVAAMKTNSGDRVTFAELSSVFTTLANRAWPASQTLTDAPVTVWDFNNGAIAYWVAGGNRSLSITNVSKDDYGLLYYDQDNTGGRNPTLPGNLPPWFEISLGSLERTLLYWTYDGTNFNWDSTPYGAINSTAPVIVSIGTSDSTHIQAVFNQVVTATNVGWSFKKNGGALAPSSVSGTGSTTLTFTVATMSPGDVLTFSYAQSTGDTVNASNLEFANTTDQSVTNNLTSSYDSDADAFFTAAGITNGTQKTAVNQLVLDLKSGGLWTKMKVIYPVVGGTAATHKFNLKNPADSDAAFRGTMSAGGITHSGTGMAFNGSSGYVDTHFNVFTDSLAGPPVFANFTDYQKFHVAYYNRTNTTPSTDWMPFGAIRSGQQISWDNYNPGNIAINAGAGSTSASGVSNWNRLLVITRQTSTLAKGFRDGTQVGSNITTSYSGNFTATNMFVGAADNAGSPAFYANSECAFFCMGDELSDSDVTVLTTAVNTFETSLSRNV